MTVNRQYPHTPSRMTTSLVEMLLRSFQGYEFSEGNRISTTPENIRSIIARVENVLGVEPREREFSVKQVPNLPYPFEKACGVFDSVRNTFYFGKVVEEGTLFHEAVHYILSQELPVSERSEQADLYTILFDETIAEFATSATYGDYTRAARLLFALHQHLVQADIVYKHRMMGERYRDYRDSKKLEEDIAFTWSILNLERSFNSVLDGTENGLVAYNMLIKILSVDNARRLNASGLTPAALMQQIRKEVTSNRGDIFYGRVSCKRYVEMLC